MKARPSRVAKLRHEIGVPTYEERLIYFRGARRHSVYYILPKEKKGLIEGYPNTMTDKPVTDARLYGLENRVRIPFATHGA